MLQSALHLPSLTFQASQVSIAQGVLGVLFTGLFFLLNFLSKFLKATDNRMEIAADTRRERQRLEKIMHAQKQAQSKAAANRSVLMMIQYDFAQDSPATTSIETLRMRHESKLLDSSANAVLLEFPSLKKAFGCALEIGQAVLQYYKTLRPIDPQPPFMIGIHAPERTTDMVVSREQIQQLCRYAGKNQTLFSKDAMEMLQATHVAGSYQYQSQGFYDFLGLRQQEVFRLLGEKH